MEIEVNEEEGSDVVVDDVIPRPQLKFDDAIDNSEEPFEHKLKYKPNAIVPLEESSKKHPYQFEIVHLKFTPLQLQRYENDTRYLPMESTPLVIIEEVHQLEDLCKRLMQTTEFAADLEGFTCLIQISTTDTDYIVDAIRLRNHIHLLNEPFTNPNIVKVLHGSRDDITWLQRDFGVYIVNLFDTFLAAEELGYGRSLAFLLSKYTDVVKDKSKTTEDWRIRPIPAEMIVYARADTHYLLYIYHRMKNELLDKGENSLINVLEESKNFCLREWKKKTIPKNFLRDINFKSGYYRYQSFNNVKFDDKQNYIITQLYYLRDKLARVEDEGVPLIMGKEVLFGSVHRDICTKQALLDLAKKENQLTPYLEKYADQILATIKSAKEELIRNPDAGKRYPKPPVKSNPLTPVYTECNKWTFMNSKDILNRFMKHMYGKKIKYNIKIEGQETFIASLSLLIGEETISGEGTGDSKSNAKRSAALIIGEKFMKMGLLKLTNPDKMEIDKSSTILSPEDENLPFRVEEAKGLFIHNWTVICKKSPKFETATEGKLFKATVTLPIGEDQISATHNKKKEAEKMAAFQACKVMYERGDLRIPSQKQAAPQAAQVKTPNTALRPIEADGDVLCKGCEVVLCRVADIYLGRHLEIKSASWAKEEFKSRFNLKPHAVKEGQLKIYCKKCEFDLGAVVAQTGKPCFKHGSIILPESQKPIVPVRQAIIHKEIDEEDEDDMPLSVIQQNLKRKIDDSLTPTKRVKPESETRDPMLFYVYKLHINPAPPLPEAEREIKEIFEGFWLLSSIELLYLPTFKAVLQARISREITLSCSLKNGINLLDTQLDLIKKWNETFFTKVVRKHENPTSSGSFYFLPRFQLPNNFDIEIVLRISKEMLFKQSNLLKEIEELEDVAPLKDIREDKENCATDIEQIHNLVYKRGVVTPYNGLFYFASSVDFDITVNDRMMQNSDQTFVQYYAARKKLQIKNTDQPIIMCDLQKLIGNETTESDHCIKLVPELCNLSKFPFEVFYYGQLLPSAVEYLSTMVAHCNKLLSWTQKFGVKITDYSLLKQAFTYPNYAEQSETVSHFKSLEFLGDGVLELVAVTHCFTTHPFAGEGRLTSFKAEIVRNSNLTKIAKELEMDKVLLLPASHDKISDDMLANTFEAFLAALFLDKGLVEAARFCRMHLLNLQNKHGQVLGNFEIDASCKGVAKATRNSLQGIKDWLTSNSIPCNSEELFLQAITHISACSIPSFSYERAEFLGDGVLKYLASVHVYNARLTNGSKLPERADFNLSEDRMPLINNENLAKICREVKLAEHLVHNESVHDKVYSDIVEAMIGAIFVDSGLKNVKLECGCKSDLAGNFFHTIICSNVNKI